MKRILLASALAVSVSACATNPYGYNDGYYNNGYQYDSQGRRVATGAAVGGVAGAVIKGRQYYRDTRGYCYYVDQYGNPIYDYNTRC
jgi:hypothetical protein